MRDNRGSNGMPSRVWRALTVPSQELDLPRVPDLSKSPFQNPLYLFESSVVFPLKSVFPFISKLILQLTLQCCQSSRGFFRVLEFWSSGVIPYHRAPFAKSKASISCVCVLCDCQEPLARCF